jgi:hypothetical protein
MVGEFSATYCEHSIVRLADRAGGKISVEKQVIRGRVALRPGGLQRTARGGRQRDCQQEDYNTHTLRERRGKSGMTFKKSTFWFKRCHCFKHCEPSTLEMGD